ncbi:hypothetical protein PFISCL1PPCAC_13452, partial [Pristionchus fissidentatus]
SQKARTSLVSSSCWHLAVDCHAGCKCTPTRGPSRHSRLASHISHHHSADVYLVIVGACDCCGSDRWRRACAAAVRHDRRQLPAHRRSRRACSKPLHSISADPDTPFLLQPPSIQA